MVEQQKKSTTPQNRKEQETSPSEYRKLSRKQSLEYLAAQMQNDLATFKPQWRDCADYMAPTRPKWSLSQTNKGDRRNQKIIDSTAVQALRTLRSGMMSGITSPARPWFRLSVSDAKQSENANVKQWLYNVGLTMSQNFLRSNLYQVLPNCYKDMGWAGTGIIFAERNLDTTLRYYSIPIGECCIYTDAEGKVRGFFRDIRYTVRQVIEKFGLTNPERPNEIDWSKFSDSVKAAWMNNQTEQPVDVRHFVLKNPDADPGRSEAKFKPFLSVYYERGTNAGQTPATMATDEKYLRESGFDYFPVFGPRWEVSGNDTYATNCPGFEALGDTRALQLLQKRKAQAIEKMINPPLVKDPSVKSENVLGLPGRSTTVSANTARAGVQAMYQIQIDLNAILLDIQDHQRRVSKAFYEDLFLMITNSDGDVTATEIRERKEEKLLALGPVLEQVSQDLLDPLIDTMFFEMVEQGQVPEPPPEIQGLQIKVEYISIMAQAQKLVGIGTMDRFLGMASQIVAFNPASLDKIDTDQALDIYAELTSIPPGVVRSDEDVERIRAQRAARQAAEVEAQNLQAAAKSAKDLSQASLDNNSALSELVARSNAGALA